jgi:hypothetical protein
VSNPVRHGEARGLLGFGRFGRSEERKGAGWGILAKRESGIAEFLGEEVSKMRVLEILPL